MSDTKVFSTLGTGNREREKDDFYETPHQAVRCLMEVEQFDGEIWECACGKNAIVNELKKDYNNIYFSDLIDRGVSADVIDFLKSDRKTNNIITNPPFKLALPFVKKALELVDNKVAMLLRIQFLEGKERCQFFKDNPPNKVYVFSNRVNNIVDGTPYNSAMCLAWFIWDKKEVCRDTIVKWLKY